MFSKLRLKLTIQMPSHILTVLISCLLTSTHYTAAAYGSSLINHSAGSDISAGRDKDESTILHDGPLIENPYVNSYEKAFTFKPSANIYRTQNSPDNANIRLLFLYVETVAHQHSIEEIDLAIGELIQQTNHAYQETGIAANVEAAHVGAWPFGNNEQIATMNAIDVFSELRRWVNSELWGEGGLMQLYGADAVFLVDVRDDADNYCGWANIDTKEGLLNKDSSNSFGLIRLGRGCGTTAAILAHELGHLLGSAHGNEDTLTASSSLGHGVVCDDQSTIMHRGFPKHLLFSNPLLLRGGQTCGDTVHANNAKLFGENTALLANKQTYQTPSSDVSLILTDSYRSPTQPAKVTFYRSGIVNQSAQVEWHYKDKNIQNTNTLVGGVITFEPGEINKTVEIPAPQLIDSSTPQFSIYLRNPLNVFADNNELLITLNETPTNAINVNFLIETEGLSLTLYNMSSHTTDIEIAEIQWTISNSNNHYFHQGTESVISIEVLNAGIYNIQLSVFDTEGEAFLKSMDILIEDTSSGTISRNPTAGDNSTFENSLLENQGGGGASLHIIFVLALMKIFEMSLSYRHLFYKNRIYQNRSGHYMHFRNTKKLRH